MASVKSVSFVAAISLLAIHPALWLVQTWIDPSYDSRGGLAFVATLLLFGWSWRSPGPAPKESDRARARLLLMVTALLRAAGELLAVRTVGALALVIDVYALALGAGVARRSVSLSPAGLATLFAFSLPCDRIVERVLGHPLQLISARLACSLLSLTSQTIRCEGTRIFAPPAELSVDLPCSGARGLVLMLGFWAAGLATRRLEGRRAVLGLGAAILGAAVANTVRLELIATWMSHGVDAGVEPLHSILGTIALFLGALPMALQVRAPIARVDAASAHGSMGVRASRSVKLGGRPLVGWYSPALLGIAIAVVSIPSRPIDVSPTSQRPLPVSLGTLYSELLPLEGKEVAYFEKFGGSASKRRYFDQEGSFTVVSVRTHSPLRHLHSPEECLRGAGHEARLLGIRTDSTAVYETRDPDGRRWQVDVSFVSDRGVRATNPSEVVWRWLEEPTVAWTMVERITPLGFCARRPGICHRRESALFHALEIPKEKENQG
ncbi:MAG: exosortase T [Deltaproteobacteria bacterium]|nr:exosortase T [Deltaproteobacteria bacterium]